MCTYYDAIVKPSMQCIITGRTEIAFVFLLEYYCTAGVVNLCSLDPSCSLVYSSSSAVLLLYTVFVSRPVRSFPCTDFFMVLKCVHKVVLPPS